jgi:hypothetical protein
MGPLSRGKNQFEMDLLVAEWGVVLFLFLKSEVMVKRAVEGRRVRWI